MAVQGLLVVRAVTAALVVPVVLQGSQGRGRLLGVRQRPVVAAPVVWVALVGLAGTARRVRQPVLPVVRAPLVVSVVMVAVVVRLVVPGVVRALVGRPVPVV